MRTSTLAGLALAFMTAGCAITQRNASTSAADPDKKTASVRFFPSDSAYAVGVILRQGEKEMLNVHGSISFDKAFAAARKWKAGGDIPKDYDSLLSPTKSTPDIEIKHMFHTLPNGSQMIFTRKSDGENELTVTSSDDRTIFTGTGYFEADALISHRHFNGIPYEDSPLMKHFEAFMLYTDSSKMIGVSGTEVTLINNGIPEDTKIYDSAQEAISFALREYWNDSKPEAKPPVIALDR